MHVALLEFFFFASADAGNRLAVTAAAPALSAEGHVEILAVTGTVDVVAAAAEMVALGRTNSTASLPSGNWGSIPVGKPRILFTRRRRAAAITGASAVRAAAPQMRASGHVTPPAVRGTAAIASEAARLRARGTQDRSEIELEELVLLGVLAT